MKKITTYIVFIIIFYVSKIHAEALLSTYDVYFNDDGAECIILIDVAPRFASWAKLPDEEKINAIRRYVIDALKATKNGCDQGGVPSVSAITIAERDPYGQPKWGSVEYLIDFELDNGKLECIYELPCIDELELLLPIKVNGSI